MGFPIVLLFRNFYIFEVIRRFILEFIQFDIVWKKG